MAVILTILLYVSIWVNLAVSTPASNITSYQSAHDKLPGCVCPWEKGDYGCHIVDWFTFQSGLPTMWPIDYDAAFCAQVDMNKWALKTWTMYQCPGGSAAPNCNACRQAHNMNNDPKLTDCYTFLFWYK